MSGLGPAAPDLAKTVYVPIPEKSANTAKTTTVFLDEFILSNQVSGMSSIICQCG